VGRVREGVGRGSSADSEPESVRAFLDRGRGDSPSQAANGLPTRPVHIGDGGGAPPRSHLMKLISRSLPVTQSSRNPCKEAAVGLPVISNSRISTL